MHGGISIYTQEKTEVGQLESDGVGISTQLCLTQSPRSLPLPEIVFPHFPDCEFPITLKPVKTYHASWGSHYTSLTPLQNLLT